MSTRTPPQENSNTDKRKTELCDFLSGVLENGLFVNLADEVLVGEISGDVAGVRSLEKR